MWRLAALAVPIAEIAAFILVGGWIGLGPTLLLVLAATALGVLLLRSQGREAAAALRRARHGGPGSRIDPAALLVRGGFRLMAGLLLIVPGFLSDALALALLLPPVQRAVLRRLQRRGGVARHETMRFGAGGSRAGRAPSGPASTRPVIDADWEEVPRPDVPSDAQAGSRPRPPSGWTRS